MTTTEAIKFCFTDEVYDAARKGMSPPEMLKTACLTAFKNQYMNFPVTSFHFHVAEQLRKALTTLDNTGIFEE